YHRRHTPMTTKELLDRLNHLRAARGMKPLKAWKASKKKLHEAIASLEGAAPSYAEEVAESYTPDVDAPAEDLANLDEKMRRVRGVVKAMREEVAKEKYVTLAEIARELGMSPKVARAKMRRIGVPSDFVVKKHVFLAQHKSWVIDA